MVLPWLLLPVILPILVSRPVVDYTGAWLSPAKR
jgi:hypothetical protein